MSRTSKLLLLFSLVALFSALLFTAIVQAQDMPQPVALNQPDYLAAKVVTLNYELRQAYQLVSDFQTKLTEVTRERDALKAKLKELEDEK